MRQRAPLPKREALSPLFRRFAPVSLVILAATFVLGRYISGEATPPWDFYSNYLTGAHSWWDLGSFFDPPSFIPYIVGGYPAYLGIQGSGWYLPVGLFAGLFDYTPHSAAALQALTVAFGVVGAYVLAGQLGLRRTFSTVAGLGYLFTAGFFANAQHVDILRGWAFFPWLLTAAYRPRLNSPLLIGLTALLWFQFFVGAYPGSIVATAYLCGGWVLLTLWRRRGERAEYVVWLLATAGVGLVLAAPKWLPYLLASGSDYRPGNGLDFNLGIVATLFFPFTSDAIPNDLSMRTFFVVPVLVIAAFFITGRGQLSRYALLLVGMGALLGIPVWPLTVLQEALPLLDLSRFRMTDFKVGIVLGLVLLGAAGLQSMSESRHLSPPDPRLRARIGAAAGTTILVCLSGFAAGLPSHHLVIGLYWVAVSVMAIIFVRWLALRRRSVGLPWREASVACLVVVVIGSSWSKTAEFVWSVPREAKETATWGQPAYSLIAQRSALHVAKRPERLGPPFPASEGAVGAAAKWNGSEYSRQPAMTGYMNLKGIPLFEEYVALSTDPAGVPTMELLQQESIAWLLPVDRVPSSESGGCATSGECVPAGLEVVGWEPGVIDVRVPLGTTSRVAINELAYPGWTASACNENSCRPASVGPQTSDFYLSAVVEDDVTAIRFVYQTPFEGLAWMVFGAGLIGLLVAIGLSGLRVMRTDRLTAGAAS